MAIIYFVKIKGVSEVRARVYFFWQVFDKVVEEKRVSARVENSDSLSKGVFQERFENVPVKN